MMQVAKYLFLLLPFLFCAQNGKLIPVKVGSKWGFMDAKNTLIIPAKYDRANPFAEYERYDKTERKIKKITLAKVFEDRKMKCILADNTELPCDNLSRASENSSSDILTESESKIRQAEMMRREKDEKIIDDFKKQNIGQFDDVKIAAKNPLLFRITKNKKYGITDEKGTVIIPADFEIIETKSFSNSQGKHEAYFIGKSLDPKTSNLYFSDRGKKFAENFMPYFPVHPSGNLIKIQDSKGKYRIYNFQQKKYINKNYYDKLDSSYDNGLLLAERNGSEFYIDETGKEYVYR